MKESLNALTPKIEEVNNRPSTTRELDDKLVTLCRVIASEDLIYILVHPGCIQHT